MSKSQRWPVATPACSMAQTKSHHGGAFVVGWCPSAMSLLLCDTEVHPHLCDTTLARIPGMKGVGLTEAAQ
ncbi:MAG: hypothetical protein NTW20_02005 [Rhodobacterales bacterium]|nr:hypothetical protein [Rhodobacterales bacterium]